MRIRPVSRSDITTIAEIGNATFADDALNNWLYPGKKQYPDDSRRWQILRLRSRLVEPGSYGLVCETESGDDVWNETAGSQIIGYIFFIAKGQGEEVEKWQNDCLMNKIERRLLVLETWYEQTLGNRTVDLSARAEYSQWQTSNARPQQYWYLALLGVSPHFQRRGVGARLVEEALKSARAVELPMLLDATVMGAKLYEKMGFKVVQRATVGPENVEMTIMIYEPNESVLV